MKRIFALLLTMATASASAVNTLACSFDKIHMNDFDIQTKVCVDYYDPGIVILEKDGDYIRWEEYGKIHSGRIEGDYLTEYNGCIGILREISRLPQKLREAIYGDYTVKKYNKYLKPYDTFIGTTDKSEQLGIDDSKEFIIAKPVNLEILSQYLK